MGVQSPSTLATEGFGIVRKEGLSIPVRALVLIIDDIRAHTDIRISF